MEQISRKSGKIIYKEVNEETGAKIHEYQDKLIK